VLAVAVAMTTITFASSLHTLVATPALYGWNWTFELVTSGRVPPVTRTQLDHTPDVASWTGFSVATVVIDGVTVPSLLDSPDARPVPPVLSGHGMDTDDQIVIGPATLAQLHKHIGDMVTVSYGTPDDAPAYVPPTPLRIVGTATFPAIGNSSLFGDHPSMGIGAWLSTGIEPPALQQALENPDPNINGPDVVVVKMRDGIDAKTAAADMQQVADATNAVFAADPNTAGSALDVLSVQRPAEIVNFRSVGTVPALLAVSLVVAAVLAFGLALVAAVRQRRSDLAVLKTLGLTRRRLGYTIANQATATAIVGLALGIPAGALLGDSLWTLFARSIYAVPRPTLPLVSVLLVVAVTLVLANLAAAIPARIAARTPAADLLRAE
jgi:hypothetical protein